MKHTIIKVARKTLLSKRGPTRLMLVISSYKIGRYAIRKLFLYYLKHNTDKDYKRIDVLSYNDIQEYHIEQTLVERLRKAGL